MIDVLWPYVKRDISCPKGSLRALLWVQFFFTFLFTCSDIFFAFIGKIGGYKNLDLRNVFALQGGGHLSAVVGWLTYSFVQKHFFYYLLFAWCLLRLGRPISYVLGDQYILKIYAIGHLMGVVFFLLLTHLSGDKESVLRFKLENGFLPVLFTFLGVFASLAPNYVYFLAPFVLIPFRHIFLFLCSCCVLGIFLVNQGVEKQFMLLYLLNALSGYIYFKILKNKATGVKMATWLKASYRELKFRSKHAKNHLHSTIKEKEQTLQESLLLSKEEYQQLTTYFKKTKKAEPTEKKMAGDRLNDSGALSPTDEVVPDLAQPNEQS